MSNLSDDFLKQKIIMAESVNIFLLSGIKLNGFISEFDSECIILDTRQLIMRQAISTIQGGVRK